MRVLLFMQLRSKKRTSHLTNHSESVHISVNQKRNQHSRDLPGATFPRFSQAMRFYSSVDRFILFAATLHTSIIQNYCNTDIACSKSINMKREPSSLKFYSAGSRPKVPFCYQFSSKIHVRNKLK